MEKITEETKRIIENCIEISFNAMKILQDTLDMGRDAIVGNYIIPWAQEAETEYQSKLEAEGQHPYYDFIDEFTQRKLNELKDGDPVVYIVDWHQYKGRHFDDDLQGDSSSNYSEACAYLVKKSHEAMEWFRNWYKEDEIVCTVRDGGITITTTDHSDTWVGDITVKVIH